MFLCRYRSSAGGQGCFYVDTCPQEEDRGVFIDTGPQEEDRGVSLKIQVLRRRTGVFLCRYRSSGGGQGCFYVDGGPQMDYRSVSL